MISVDTSGSKTLVGTARGALLIKDGEPKRVWDSSLADPYTQAVKIQDEDLWFGTFRGLNRVRSGLTQTLLKPWSVFALEPSKDQGMWVGYDQTLSHFDNKDVLSQVDWTKKVHDIIDDGTNRWISCDGFGVLRLDGKSHVVHKERGLSLALGKEGLWVAGGGRGLQKPDGTLSKVFGSVWSVARADR